MTEPARSAKQSDHWGNELWNVSFLPLPAANESGSFPPRQTAKNAAGNPAETRAELRKLENLAERRSESSAQRALPASLAQPSGKLR
jgi:hypothetical protein